MREVTAAQQEKLSQPLGSIWTRGAGAAPDRPGRLSSEPSVPESTQELKNTRLFYLCYSVIASFADKTMQLCYLCIFSTDNRLFIALYGAILFPLSARCAPL